MGQNPSANQQNIFYVIYLSMSSASISFVGFRILFGAQLQEAMIIIRKKCVLRQVRGGASRLGNSAISALLGRTITRGVGLLDYDHDSLDNDNELLRTWRLRFRQEVTITVVATQSDR